MKIKNKKKVQNIHHSDQSFNYLVMNKNRIITSSASACYQTSKVEEKSIYSGFYPFWKEINKILPLSATPKRWWLKKLPDPASRSYSLFNLTFYWSISKCPLMICNGAQMFYQHLKVLKLVTHDTITTFNISFLAHQICMPFNNISLKNASV